MRVRFSLCLTLFSSSPFLSPHHRQFSPHLDTPSIISDKSRLSLIIAMHALKDKVSQKLSNLFADSPSQSASPRHSLTDSPKASGKSFTSYFSFGARNENEDTESESPPPPPPPIRTDSYESVENCKKNQASSTTVGNDDYEGEMKELTESSAFISPDLCEFLHACLPNIVRGCKWVLVYSTLKHGISLRTLLRKSAELPGPCLLVAGDKQGAVFGAMLECPLTTTPKRKYQGTSQTFLFTTIYGQPRIFRPTGANRYYYMCMNEFLAFGGGGSFALCLDEDLLKATSGPSETFGNECLASSAEFELKNVELWGFAHASQYLSS
ncbi:TLD domain-containing protein 2 [Brassica rapa]|uniref:TLD domain-containing protein 2 n=1 Tax=Brassica campestris TaxID=3711 RepID=UPI0004F17CED|nr:TLD domain-containing protein 2 [Brassica rapa]